MDHHHHHGLEETNGCGFKDRMEREQSTRNVESFQISLKGRRDMDQME